MPWFPLFMNIEKKKCVFIGGGSVAQRKIETLLGFGARITVVSPEVTERIGKLHESGIITWISRTYLEGDLKGAFMAFAATSDKSVNERVYNEALKSNIHINTADDSEKCTFVFPSTVVRDELVIGISTSASCPAVSRRVRKEIENALPQSIGPLISVLKEYRREVINKVEDEDAKKLILKRLTDELFLAKDVNDTDHFKHRIKEILKEYRYEKGN